MSILNRPMTAIMAVDPPPDEPTWDTPLPMQEVPFDGQIVVADDDGVRLVPQPGVRSERYMPKAPSQGRMGDHEIVAFVGWLPPERMKPRVVAFIRARQRERYDREMAQIGFMRRVAEALAAVRPQNW